MLLGGYLPAVSNSNFNTAPAYLKSEVLKTGSILLDRSPDIRRFFTAITLQEYFDYKFIEEIYFVALKKRLREGE